MHKFKSVKFSNCLFSVTLTIHMVNWVQIILKLNVRCNNASNIVCLTCSILFNENILQQYKKSMALLLKQQQSNNMA